MSQIGTSSIWLIPLWPVYTPHEFCTRASRNLRCPESYLFAPCEVISTKFASFYCWLRVVSTAKPKPAKHAVSDVSRYAQNSLFRQCWCKTDTPEGIGFCRLRALYKLPEQFKKRKITLLLNAFLCSVCRNIYIYIHTSLTEIIFV